MEWMFFFRALAALIGVLGMIAVAAVVFKKFLAGKFSLPQSNKRRLSIVEVAAVDHRRRLVLIKRDQTEHLILLGNTNDLLIETVPANDSNATVKESA